MNDNTALLEFVYKNADMGKATLPYIIEKADDRRFRDTLGEILKEYTDIAAKTELQLIDSGHRDPKGLSMPEKLMTDMSLRINANMDTGVAHLADMMIKGASMGVTDISKQLDRYKGAGEQARGLAERLRRCNEDTIDKMKDFLTVVTK